MKGQRKSSERETNSKHQRPRVVLHGATGRMGGAVFCVCKRQHVPIVAAVAHKDCPHIGQDLGAVHDASDYGVIVTSEIDEALSNADVVIDFSHVHAVAKIAACAQKHHVPVVSGTTGLDADALQALKQASEQVAVLWTSNFSLGLQVLAEIVAVAVRRLGPSFDVEVCETHHRYKKDAPSGTAMRLVTEIQNVGGQKSLHYGREGLIGARPPNELGIHALRGGDVVGDHVVHLLGNGERLELTHRATSREVFAQGALFAAKKLIQRPAGMVQLADLLP